MIVIDWRLRCNSGAIPNITVLSRDLLAELHVACRSSYMNGIRTGEQLLKYEAVENVKITQGNRQAC